MAIAKFSPINQIEHVSYTFTQFSVYCYWRSSASQARSRRRDCLAVFPERRIVDALVIANPHAIVKWVGMEIERHVSEYSDVAQL
jgi:hypothetical protein